MVSSVLLVTNHPLSVLVGRSRRGYVVGKKVGRYLEGRGVGARMWFTSRPGWRWNGMVYHGTPWYTTMVPHHTMVCLPSGDHPQPPNGSKEGRNLWDWIYQRLHLAIQTFKSVHSLPRCNIPLMFALLDTKNSAEVVSRMDLENHNKEQCDCAVHLRQRQNSEHLLRVVPLFPLFPRPVVPALISP